MLVTDRRREGWVVMAVTPPPPPPSHVLVKLLGDVDLDSLNLGDDLLERLELSHEAAHLESDSGVGGGQGVGHEGGGVTHKTLHLLVFGLGDLRRILVGLLHFERLVLQHRQVGRELMSGYRGLKLE